MYPSCHGNASIPYNFFHLSDLSCQDCAKAGHIQNPLLFLMPALQSEIIVMVCTEEIAKVPARRNRVH
jgi:hypothetical protein